MNGFNSFFVHSVHYFILLEFSGRLCVCVCVVELFRSVMLKFPKQIHSHGNRTTANTAGMSRPSLWSFKSQCALCDTQYTCVCKVMQKMLTIVFIKISTHEHNSVHRIKNRMATECG